MLELVERFTRAWANPQLDRFIELLHPDGRLLQPVTKPIEGRDAARQVFARLVGEERVMNSQG